MISDIFPRTTQHYATGFFSSLFSCFGLLLFYEHEFFLETITFKTEAEKDYKENALTISDKCKSIISR